MSFGCLIALAVLGLTYLIIRGLEKLAEPP